MSDAEIIGGDKKICPLLSVAVEVQCLEKRCGFYNRSLWCCGISLIGD